jgi:hypothetical protein
MSRITITIEQIINMAREQGCPETATDGVFLVNADDLGRLLAAEREILTKLIRNYSNGMRILGSEDKAVTAGCIADLIEARSKP